MAEAIPPLSMTFEQRTNELLRNPKPILTVQLEEIAAIAAQFSGDEARLAALEALIRPRLAYEWRQAGGPASAFADVSAEALAAARDYYRKVRERRGLKSAQAAP